MTPEEQLNAMREKTRARGRRFKERVIAGGGIDAYRAKMAEYRRRYRAKQKGVVEPPSAEPIADEDTDSPDVKSLDTWMRLRHLNVLYSIVVDDVNLPSYA